MHLAEREQSFQFLLHDRDSKFSDAFDEVFRSEGMRIIRTPIRAPNANAYAERWVGTLRRECLDRILIVNRRHLEHVLRVYTTRYNQHRPHRSLSLQPPDQPPVAVRVPPTRDPQTGTTGRPRQRIQSRRMTTAHIHDRVFEPAGFANSSAALRSVGFATWWSPTTTELRVHWSPPYRVRRNPFASCSCSRAALGQSGIREMVAPPLLLAIGERMTIRSHGLDRFSIFLPSTFPDAGTVGEKGGFAWPGRLSSTSPPGWRTQSR